MYIPAHFAETDLATLHAFVARHGFATLVTQYDGLPFASHLPLLLDASDGPNGTLIGHMARANPQWRKAGGQSALAIFSGPHVYVSPTWYEAQNVVPTWNYVAVHAYGRVELVQERDALIEILRRTVATYESNLSPPWIFDDSTDDVQRLLKQIVGFRIPIERLEGKWKLNQNHPRERREKVMRVLRERTDESSLAIADLMEQSL